MEIMEFNINLIEYLNKNQDVRYSDALKLFSFLYGEKVKSNLISKLQNENFIQLNKPEETA